MKLVSKQILVMAVPLAVVATPAAAADPPDPPAAAVASVLDCRKLADSAARLRCFDSTSTALADAVAKGDVVALDRGAIARERRSLFGFPLPRIGLFSSDDDQSKSRLEASSRSARPIAGGKWLITLDTGARWQTTEPSYGQPPPASGQKVEIRSGAIGGYMMSIDGGILRRAKRLD